MGFPIELDDPTFDLWLELRLQIYDPTCDLWLELQIYDPTCDLWLELRLQINLAVIIVV